MRGVASAVADGAAAVDVVEGVAMVMRVSPSMHPLAAVYTLLIHLNSNALVYSST